MSCLVTSPRADILYTLVNRLKEWFIPLGKHAYTHSCQQLDEKVDTTHACLLNMRVQPALT